MKGKILKRLASAMLGLMFAVTAVEMKGFAADEVAANQTMATVTFANVDNDEIEDGKDISFHVFVKFTKTTGTNATGTVKINKFKVTFEDVNEVFKNATAGTDYKFERIISANVDGTAGYNGKKFTYEFSVPEAQAQVFNLGETVDLLKFTGKIDANKADTVKAGFEVKTNTAGTEFALDSVKAINAGAANASTTLRACEHEYDNENPIKVTDTQHTAKCKKCGKEKTENHTLANPTQIAATAEHLGGTAKTCSVCKKVIYSDLSKLAGTTPRFMPNGTTAISGYQGLNFVVVDINGYKVMVQDALNLFSGKKLVLTATDASDTVFKQVSTKISPKYGSNGLKVYTLELKADETAVKADELKKGIRVLYQIPDGFTGEEYTDILKLAGVTGDFESAVEKINDIQYVAVWMTSASGPYVVLSKAGTATTTAENKSTTSTSGKSAKTGDATGMVCLAASGLMIVAGLYMELMKKKKNA